MVIKKWHCGCLSFTSDCIFKPKVLELQNMGMGQTCVTIATDVLSKEECELTTLNQRCVYKGLNTFKNTLQRRNLEKRINVQVVHYHPSDRQALFSYDSRFHVDLGLDGDYNRILSPTIVPNYDKESLQNELAYLKHLHANDPDLFNKIKDEAMGIVPPNIYVGLLNAYVTENKKETTSAAGTKPTKPPPSNATTPTKPAVSASLAGDTIWADPDDTAMPPDDAKSTVTPSTASKDDAPINDDDTKIVLAEEGEGVSTESVELEKDATKPIKNNDQTTLKGGTKPSSETKEGRNMPVESMLGKVVEDAAASEHEEGGICKGGYDDDTTKQPSTTMISRGGTFDQLNTAKSDVEMAAASKAVEPPTQSKESSFNNGIAGGGGGKLRGKDLSSHPEMREASHVLLDIAGGNAKVANIKQTAQRISPRRQKRSRGSEHNSAGDNGNGRPKRQAAMNRKGATRPSKMNLKREKTALLKKLSNIPSSVYEEESAWRFYNPGFLKDSSEQLTALRGKFDIPHSPANVAAEELRPLPPAMSLPQLPNTDYCKWSFDEKSRVLLANFRESTYAANKDGKIEVGREDEDFLFKMMERDDITVISEGLADSINSSLWTREYIEGCIGSEYHHKFRRFETKHLQGQPATQPTEKEGWYSMKVSDYFDYLEKRQSVKSSALNGAEVEQRDTSKDFTFIDSGGQTKTVNVDNESLYMIDVDLVKLLPHAFQDFQNSFKLPGILPGGSHCMMNAVSWLTAILLVFANFTLAHCLSLTRCCFLPPLGQRQWQTIHGSKLVHHPSILVHSLSSRWPCK